MKILTLFLFIIAISVIFIYKINAPGYEDYSNFGMEDNDVDENPEKQNNDGC